MTETDRELILEIRGDVKEVRLLAQRTNGRVTALEVWKREEELTAAHQAGLLEARDLWPARFSRAQMGGVATGAVVLTGIIGLALRVFGF